MSWFVAGVDMFFPCKLVGVWSRLRGFSFNKLHRAIVRFGEILTDFRAFWVCLDRCAAICPYEFEGFNRQGFTLRHVVGVPFAVVVVVKVHVVSPLSLMWSH